jgi:hypothetical protein
MTLGKRKACPKDRSMQASIEWAAGSDRDPAADDVIALRLARREQSGPIGV